ncbi:MAG: PD-(D/E)XK nuclease family protein [Chloroflexi bacterium]|nr:PD-(D/E)XK nuclease family protein [Chloroflexota bacterium]
MVRSRDGVYVWVTWLAKLMAGEFTCQWSAWFRSHYTGYTRAPSDFQLAAWTAEHAQLLDELVRERAGVGEAVYREDQNRFRVRRSSGLRLAGKPDLIAIDRSGRVTVYDAKTGRPKHSDLIQIMLYMMCLPHASPLYKGKALHGCAIYANGQRSDIPPAGIDDAFRRTATYFLDLLDASSPPRRTPTVWDCRFCDITVADCEDRLEAEATADALDDGAEIPL